MMKFQTIFQKNSESSNRKNEATKSISNLQFHLTGYRLQSRLEEHKSWNPKVFRICDMASRYGWIFKEQKILISIRNFFNF
jgi:hypothetical protein